jgi:hypothetical protein
MKVMKREDAIRDGLLYTIRTEPIFVDMTRNLYSDLILNAHKDDVPSIISEMEEQVKVEAQTRKFHPSQLPLRYGSFTYQWHNWPKHKTGPVCGYITYDAVLSMQGTQAAMLLLRLDEQ